MVAMHHYLGRAPRLHGQLVGFRNRRGYERRVSKAIARLPRRGDCAWDVGANMGLYTRQFLDRVGPSGRVVAFEPLPACSEQLRRLAPKPQLTVVEAALTASNGRMPFTAAGENGEESSIGEGSDGFTVRIARGDSMLAEGIPRPDVIKIDVEGFESNVLDGMPVALRTARAVIVEVHFQALRRRGQAREPIRIRALLRDQGFEVRWLDTSHLIATR